MVITCALKVPLCHHRPSWPAASRSPNFDGAACADQTHPPQSAQSLWFPPYKTGSPARARRRRTKTKRVTISIRYVISFSRRPTWPSESTCHALRHGVHSKCPHGSIRMSLSFSAHILHSWKVLPISQRGNIHVKSCYSRVRQQLRLDFHSNQHNPTHPFHSTVHTAPGSRLYGPPSGSAQQMTGLDLLVLRPDTGRIPPCETIQSK